MTVSKSSFLLVALLLLVEPTLGTLRGRDVLEREEDEDASQRFLMPKKKKNEPKVEKIAKLESNTKLYGSMVGSMIGSLKVPSKFFKYPERVTEADYREVLDKMYDQCMYRQQNVMDLQRQMFYSCPKFKTIPEPYIFYMDPHVSSNIYEDTKNMCERMVDEARDLQKAIDDCVDAKYGLKMAYRELEAFTNDVNYMLTDMNNAVREIAREREFKIKTEEYFTCTLEYKGPGEGPFEQPQPQPEPCVETNEETNPCGSGCGGSDSTGCGGSYSTGCGGSYPWGQYPLNPYMSPCGSPCGSQGPCVTNCNEATETENEGSPCNDSDMYRTGCNEGCGGSYPTGCGGSYPWGQYPWNPYMSPCGSPCGNPCGSGCNEATETENEGSPCNDSNMYRTGCNEGCGGSLSGCGSGCGSLSGCGGGCGSYSGCGGSPCGFQSPCNTPCNEDTDIAQQQEPLKKEALSEGTNRIYSDCGSSSGCGSGCGSYSGCGSGCGFSSGCGSGCPPDGHAGPCNQTSGCSGGCGSPCGSPFPWGPSPYPWSPYPYGPFGAPTSNSPYGSPYFNSPYMWAGYQLATSDIHHPSWYTQTTPSFGNPGL